MQKESIPYKTLCSQYYELDKPEAPHDALNCYLRFATEIHGPILEPMCGTGRFLVPLAEKGYPISGFDSSPHMLEFCRKKCQKLGLNIELFESTFETFIPKNNYDLIFIPSSSFCLLTDEKQISHALTSVINWLNPNGKFIFEIETLNSVNAQPGVWKGTWVDKQDGSKIVLSTLSKFDDCTSIETILCQYTLWEKNRISQIEVEDFRLKHYEPFQIENLLMQHGFKIIGKWKTDPHKLEEAPPESPTIMYECKKPVKSKN